eukprot:3295364-Pyramimonas_sp.AAC.1
MLVMNVVGFLPNSSYPLAICVASSGHMSPLYTLAPACLCPFKASAAFRLEAPDGRPKKECISSVSQMAPWQSL